MKINGTIENVTDQLDIYVEDVLSAIDTVMSTEKYTIDQAIKIVEVGAVSMKTEVLHHMYTSFMGGEYSLHILED